MKALPPKALPPLPVLPPFVPVDFDPGDFARIEPLCRALLQRDLSTTADLRHWVLDLSALYERISEEGARRRIANACHTEDTAIEERFTFWIREIEPKLKPVMFELQKKFLSSPAVAELGNDGFEQMTKEWRTEVEIFRPENVPLQTQAAELVKDYGKIMGAMLIDFRGQQYTPQQMARFLEETDRPTREEAWRLAAQRRLQDRERTDDIFEQLLKLRHQMAVNAGFTNYRDYAWKSRNRFDYAPEDCLAFADAVERVCVPLVEELDRQRRSSLGVESLRPWDLAVDVEGRAPLRPFEATDIAGFVEKTRQAFARIEPTLAEQFTSLRTHDGLDLESRKGKRPGGFQAALEASKQPFIFMNAAGLQGDVETLLHEGGHAFHYLAAAKEPNLFVRHAPLEFCEVASMSMELLGADHFGIYYQHAEEAERAKRLLLEGVIRLFPWVATIDSYQHWLYTHPGHTRQERTDYWLQLHRRFSGEVVDWTNLDAERASRWQQQLHLYHHPFYYIEYGIAQLGALSVWRNYRNDPARALRQLREAFALGGTRSLPELFTTAGLRFDFSEKTLRPLIESLAEELARMPV